MTLTIPDVDEAVERKLRALAASHGRTLQAEAREILARTVENETVENTDEGSPQELMRKTLESLSGIWKDRGTTEENAPDADAVLPTSAREAVRGLWTKAMTTDELMNITRGDDSDDAYTRR